ncbi:hypothetical protein MASR1M36_02830 [Candidatus Cloacimonadaceae bacterium]
MRTINGFLCALLVLAVFFAPACSKPQPKAEEAIPELKSLAQDLLGNLEQIDAAMADNIAKHANKFGTEAEIRELLAATATVHPAILTSCYVDTKGILKYLEPAKYKESEGADISKQEHIVAMLKDQKPFLSTAFRAVEGFATVVLGQPLFDAKQKFVGALVLTLDTSALPKLVMEKNAVPDNYELWAMEPNGMTVCDQDKEEIGLNILSDPLYQPFESLRVLAKKIGESPNGEGVYSFKAAGTETVVEKKATWDTISMHGREWRVVLVSKEK